MQEIRQEPREVVTALYDSECPLCRFGARHYEAQSGQAGVRMIDMREASSLKEEAVARGFDLDRGMVVKSGEQFYYSGDAVHFLAMRADGSRWLNRQICRLLRSRTCSRLLYPVFRTARLVLLWLKSVPKVSEADAGRMESTIKKQLGEEWHQLHPNVQARFATDPALSDYVFYRGTMQRVECSLAGKIFAHFTRLIANPLTPFEGKNVRMDVMLYRRTGLAGVYWRRTYYYPGRAPCVVTSVKRQDAQGRMTECVGAGFGMVLKVAAKEGSLHFNSMRYFWQLGGLRIPLPHLLTPGETHVVHEDSGGGAFRFTISMDHVWLGRTFYQTGIFREA